MINELIKPPVVTGDSVTHINIWYRADTELGRLLSHFSYSPFVHPYYGPFNSMEGFWFYIRSIERDDKLRNLYGAKAKEYGRTLTCQWCPNFREIINIANFYKIEQNEHLKKLVLASTLPFKSYYLFGEGQVLIHPKEHEWLVQGFEENRKMFQWGMRPHEIEYDQTDKKV